MGVWAGGCGWVSSVTKSTQQHSPEFQNPPGFRLAPVSWNPARAQGIRQCTCRCGVVQEASRGCAILYVCWPSGRTSYQRPSIPRAFLSARNQKYPCMLHAAAGSAPSAFVGVGEVRSRHGFVQRFVVWSVRSTYNMYLPRYLLTYPPEQGTLVSSAPGGDYCVDPPIIFRAPNSQQGNSSKEYAQGLSSMSGLLLIRYKTTASIGLSTQVP